jgi:hypothetical protein
MFLIPGNYLCQLSNMQGDQSVKLLHCSYFAAGDVGAARSGLFLQQSAGRLRFALRPGSARGLFRSQSRDAQRALAQGATDGNIWFGNFFADMRAWDRLDHFERRGAGGHVVWVGFPSSPISAHMSVFPARTYKKGHRHGPGYLIVIPAGEGYSIMWPEGGEKIIIPWHEASLFVPPNRWFHQHFTLAARRRAIWRSIPRAASTVSAKKSKTVRATRSSTPRKDPMIREKFESELARKGLQSVMPDEAYRNRDYEWSYTQKKAS